jgi:hypothetical protein
MGKNPRISLLPLSVLLSQIHRIVISTEAQRNGEICFSTPTSSKLQRPNLSLRITYALRDSIG